jgi:hypothetical protein
MSTKTEPTQEEIEAAQALLELSKEVKILSLPRMEGDTILTASNTEDVGFDGNE